MKSLQTTIRTVVRTALLTSFVAGLAVTTSSCLVNRSLLRLTDHPSKSLLLVETRDTFAYVTFAPMLGSWTVHQFWECTEDEGQANCAPICGEDMSAKCPAWEGEM